MLALINSLLKQNMKSCNAKETVMTTRKVKKINNNRSKKPQKNNFARAAHFFSTFFRRCFALLQRDPVNLFFSLPLVFTLVAASISHFLTATINFHAFLSTKLVSVVFYYSVIHVNVDIKI